MTRECPCTTCCREKRCADKCPKWREWFSKEWNRLRNLFLGGNNG